MDSTIQKAPDSIPSTSNKSVVSIPKKSSEDNNWKDKKLGEENIKIFGISTKEVYKMYHEEGLSESEMLKKFNREETFFNQLLIHRVVRIAHISLNDAINNFLEEIPLMMFFLIPFFALMLKLFYFKQHFVAHLIFTLNLHAFIFLMFGVFLLANNYADINRWIILVFFLLMFIYVYKSFRNVYRQRRILTFFKIFSFFIGYNIILVIGLVFALIASFAFS